VIVGNDRACELGAWIYGEGRSLVRLPEYERLRAVHADFHMYAAELVWRAA
jgi:hypothetical protein